MPMLRSSWHKELPSGKWPIIGRIYRLLPTPLPFDALSEGGFSRAIRFIFGMEKVKWLCYNLVKIAWWSTQSFGHNTSTWQTHRHNRHSKFRVNALRRVAKIYFNGLLRADGYWACSRLASGAAHPLMMTSVQFMFILSLWHGGTTNDCHTCTLNL